MDRLLQVGDVFRSKRFVEALYRVIRNDNSEPTLDKKQLCFDHSSEMEVHWTERNGDGWERQRKTKLDRRVEDQDKIHQWAFKVIDTRMTGGGTGMGPHDIYPDGHQVTATDAFGRTMVFFQSGAFVGVIPPKDIDLVPGPSTLTDAEAEALLAQLEHHYRQPVLPLYRFCDAITTWMRAIEQNNTEEAARREHPLGRWRPEDQWGHSYWQHLSKIKTDIRKSELLHRLLYKKEKLRTQRCPVHKGHQYLGQHPPCPHGCGLTGWLPEPADGVNKG